MVFRGERLERILAVGRYWIRMGERLEVYDMSEPFTHAVPMGILLQHTDFARIAEVIDVPDNELVFRYVRNNFDRVLKPGRHVFWKGWDEQSFFRVKTDAIDIPEALDMQLVTSPVLAPYVRSYRMEAYEKGLLFVNGQMDRVLEPGNYYWWKNHTMIHVVKVDMRQINMEISGQEILTRDKAQLRINFSVQYQVRDIMKALADNKDYEKQLYVLIQLALRECVGGMSLDELMTGKEEIAVMVLKSAVARSERLGVVLLGCGVKDIILPGDIREIMNRVLIAEKKAQANLITRREETASTRSLLNTARLMEENAMLYKLKEMEFVERIAENINSISVSGNGQIVDQLKQIFIK